MDCETISWEKSEGVCVITLNRPDRLNAISTQVIDEIGHALAKARQDSDVRAIILTGSHGCFSVGADLKAERPPDFLQRFNRLNNELEDSSRPIIAAIDGYCLGGGFEMAMSCDFRVASQSAKIGSPEVDRCLMPAAGATYRLPRLVGLTKAMELLLTGEIISGEEAYKCGVVTKVVAPGEEMGEARKLAEVLAAKSPVVVGAIKSAIHYGVEASRDVALQCVTSYGEWVRTTEDSIEGRKAFAEKRKPVWKGNNMR